MRQLRRKRPFHWGLLVAAICLFGVGLWLVGEHFTAGLVTSRLIDALGDVLMDRGISVEV